MTELFRVVGVGMAIVGVARMLKRSFTKEDIDTICDPEIKMTAVGTVICVLSTLING